MWHSHPFTLKMARGGNDLQISGHDVLFCARFSPAPRIIQNAMSFEGPRTTHSARNTRHVNSCSSRGTPRAMWSHFTFWIPIIRSFQSLQISCRIFEIERIAWISYRPVTWSNRKERYFLQSKKIVLTEFISLCVWSNIDNSRTCMQIFTRNTFT